MPQKRSPLKNLGPYAGVKKSRLTCKQVSKVPENVSQLCLHNFASTDGHEPQHPCPLNTSTSPTPVPPTNPTKTTAHASAPDPGVQTVQQPLSHTPIGLREGVAGLISRGNMCDMDGSNDEKYSPTGVFKFLPLLELAQVVHANLSLILRPP